MVWLAARTLPQYQCGIDVAAIMVRFALTMKNRRSGILTFSRGCFCLIYQRRAGADILPPFPGLQKPEQRVAQDEELLEKSDAANFGDLLEVCDRALEKGH